MKLPESFTLNAWTDPVQTVGGTFAASLQLFAVTERKRPTGTLAPTEEDWSDWTDPRVGWGLILRDNPDLTAAQLAAADDAPEPIQRLRAARGDAPVFRYRPKSKNRFRVLKNYATNEALDITDQEWGLGSKRIPKYLLIYGSPVEIPWDLQYALHGSFFIGRLDLEGEALDNYVTALLDDFQACASDVRQALVWAVDHGSPDITHLMRNAIAERVYKALCDDKDLRAGSEFIDGGVGATCIALIEALARKKPGLIVTTSHGRTSPLNDAHAMLANLGSPVDQAQQTLSVQALLAQWQPEGAIWYSHACCSAGSDANSTFVRLVNPGSKAGQVLNAVAALGSHVAPLPRALLGAPKPLRAFVGHVEPTFDWTLMQNATGQHLTSGLIRTLYNGLYLPLPIGNAMERLFGNLTPLFSQHSTAIKEADDGAALAANLCADDVKTTVLLGDPTAVLPPLKGSVASRKRHPSATAGARRLSRGGSS